MHEFTLYNVVIILMKNICRVTNYIFANHKIIAKSFFDYLVNLLCSFANFLFSF